MSEYNLALHKPLPREAKRVFTGTIFSIWQWQQELFDGSRALFERATRADVTHAVGVLSDGRILLTEDAQPHRRTVITPPGGKVEAGESAEEAVRREFLEETGYEIGELIPWHHYRPANDKIEYTCWAYIARKVSRVAKPQPEAGERIKVLLYTFDEFLNLGQNPNMRDLVMRIILLEAQVDAIKKEKLRNLLYG